MRAVVGENFSTREQDNNGVGFIESRPVEQGSEFLLFVTIYWSLLIIFIILINIMLFICQASTDTSAQ